MTTPGASIVLAGRSPAELARALDGDTTAIAAVVESEGDAGRRRAAEHARARPAFGLERWVPEGTEVHTVRVASYEDKLTCIDAIDCFAADHGLRGKYREAIGACVDELVMNALYAAPRVAAAGGERASAETIAARARRGVQVSWALADKTLFVSALDSYGSIDRHAMLAALTAGGDGGLGLTLMAGSCSQLWVAVAPGDVCECVCGFDTRAPRLQLAELGFVEVTDPDDIATITGELERADELARRAALAPARAFGPGFVALVVVLGLVLAAIVAVLVRS